MARYLINVRLVQDVEMSVEAASAAEAMKIARDNKMNPRTDDASDPKTIRATYRHIGEETTE